MVLFPDTFLSKGDNMAVLLWIRPVLVLQDFPHFPQTHKVLSDFWDFAIGMVIWVIQAHLNIP